VRIGTYTAVTEFDGFFRVPNVTVPYDLVVGMPATWVFRGLETVDPFITLPYSSSSGMHRAYVTGRVPWQGSAQTLVFLFGTGVAPMVTDVRDATGTYLFQPAWRGRDETQYISLFILRGSRRPEWIFDDYVLRSLEITDGQRFIVDAEERDFKPVVPLTLDVEVIRPANVPYVNLALVIPIPGRGDFYIAGRTWQDGPPVTFRAPGVPALPLQVVARSDSRVWPERAETRVEISSDRSPIQVTLRPYTLLVAPTDSAQVSADAALEWGDPGIPGVYGVHLSVEGRGEVTFYTSETRISLADVPFQDGLPPGARCDWYVESLGAARTVNDLAMRPGAIAVHDRAWSSSVRRVFWIAKAS
jgi:hypothetical protein